MARSRSRLPRRHSRWQRMTRGYSWRDWPTATGTSATGARPRWGSRRWRGLAPSRSRKGSRQRPKPGKDPVDPPRPGLGLLEEGKLAPGRVIPHRRHGLLLADRRDTDSGKCGQVGVEPMTMEPLAELYGHHLGYGAH